VLGPPFIFLGEILHYFYLSKADFMNEVQLQLDEKHRGAFYIVDNDERIAEMDVGITGDTLIAYHTEVSPKAEGKGFAKALLAAMVAHARTNHLKVLPLCPYVHAQFKRHPDEYADIWLKEE
jgi:predicted GNAT family acetyltransferase